MTKQLPTFGVGIDSGKRAFKLDNGNGITKTIEDIYAYGWAMGCEYVWKNTYASPWPGMLLLMRQHKQFVGDNYEAINWFTVGYYWSYIDERNDTSLDKTVQALVEYKLADDAMMLRDLGFTRAEFRRLFKLYVDRRLLDS